MRINVGARLRTERKSRNFSQADLERRTGLPRCRISWLENGRAIPTLETLEKISDALEIPVYRLLCEDEGRPQTKDLSAEVATNGNRRRNRKREVRLLGEFRKHFSRMSKEDQDLILVIARKITHRMSGRTAVGVEVRTT